MLNLHYRVASFVLSRLYVVATVAVVWHWELPYKQEVSF